MNTHFEYDALILKVVDGDTVDLRIDLGFSTFTDMRVRLYGINAPEMNTQAGKDAKAFLLTLVHEGTVVTIRTIKDKQEKYGRYLAIIYAEVGSVNTAMVDNGHAVPYMI